MRLFLYQSIIILIIIFNPFSSIFNILICYTFLYLLSREVNFLNPIFWLVIPWNLLFINAFTGVINYKYNVSIIEPILFCIILLLVFFLGYSFHKIRFPSIKNSVQADINFGKYLESLNDVVLEKKVLIYTFFSIVAFTLFFIEIVFIYDGDILNPASLRMLFHKRDVTILSQLSSIFYFGGLFSLTGFVFFRNSKYKTFYLLGIFSFAFGSFLSAGRQMVLQLIFILFSCFSLMKYYQVKVNLKRIHKFLLGIGFLSILGYFIFISTARSTTALYDNRTKLEIYSSLNNSTFSEDFIMQLEDKPLFIENFLVDYLFYFSHEIILFSEWWAYNEIELIDMKIIRFSPFLERQLDRFGLYFESQQDWIAKKEKKFNEGYIIEQGWPTTNKELLVNTGYLGSFLIVFTHGYFSRKLFFRTKLKPSFGLLNLCIINNVILFTTISNSTFSETHILFYILVSFLLILRKN